MKQLKQTDMKDLILNYNSHNSNYHLTGREDYNTECLKILKQVSLFSEKRREFFNKHTAICVNETTI